MAPVISLHDVHKRYRIYKERYRSLKEVAIHRRLGVWEDRWALRGVSLDVERGATLGLVGPNGAGKSTALKLMAKILTPDRGEVRTTGRVSALIELGAGFQPEYTGRENVYLNASLLGLTRGEVDRKFADIVGFAEMEEHIDAPLRTYSSGMYMRLGFSVAIHVEPEILLVDEILAVGDAAFQAKCADWLEGFQRRGGTIVLVAHDMSAIRDTCTAAAWIEHGDLVQYGKPSDVIAGYLSEVREHRLDVEQARREGRGRPAVELTDVRILDRAGRPARTFTQDDPVTVEIGYIARQRVESPIFGVALNRDDGVYVHGTNTHLDGVSVPPIEGPGTVRFSYRSMPVLGGTYLITVGVFDSPEPLAAPIDFHFQRYSFEVLPKTDIHGVVHVAHDWEFDRQQERYERRQRIG